MTDDDISTSPLHFRRLVPNWREVRCSGCNSGHTAKSICAKCKDVFYCSKECQRRDWPAHSKECVARIAPFKRLIRAFLDAEITTRIITDAVITHFQLDKRKDSGPSTDPLILGIHVVMLPDGWGDVVRAFLKPPVGPPPIVISPPAGGKKAGLDTYLQITEMSEEAPTAQTRAAAARNWKDVEDEVQDISQEYSEFPESRVLYLVFLYIVYNGTRLPLDGARLFPSTIAITNASLEGYRRGPLYTGEVEGFVIPGPMPSKRPASLADAARFINSYIQADVKNRLHLRNRLDGDEENLKTWGVDSCRSVFEIEMPPDKIPELFDFPTGPPTE